MDISLEGALVRQSKKDPEAFGLLFDHYYPIISRFIYKRVGSLDVAQDITSETFFQALKNLWRYRITSKPFSSWLFRIAVVQIAQYYRTKGRVHELTLDYAPELIARDSESADYDSKMTDDEREANFAFQDLHGALSQLPEPQHSIVVLRYFENKKINEIAEILSLKENTVKSHIRRALKRLELLLVKSDTISFREYVRQRFTHNRGIY